MSIRKVKTEHSDITLGKKYRDTILGIEGIATAKHLYISGCDRVTLEWLHNGDPKSQTFDVTELIDVAAEAEVASTRKFGGPHDAPSVKTTGDR